MVYFEQKHLSGKHGFKINNLIKKLQILRLGKLDNLNVVTHYIA